MAQILRHRVLIADDDPIVRRSLSAFVQEADDLILVGSVSNGAEAVEAAGSGAVDVVLMDVQMPVLDGIAATGELLKQRPELKVLILTALDDDSLLLAALRAGASGFLLKATTPDGLVEAIRSVVAGVTVLSNDPARSLIDRPPRPVPATPCDVELTKRERAVLELLCAGHSNAEIAAQLYLSESTVKTHVSTVLTKLGASSRLKAVVRAHELGLFPKAPS